VRVLSQSAGIAQSVKNKSVETFKREVIYGYPIAKEAI
jgi:hypothetical protein